MHLQLSWFIEGAWKIIWGLLKIPFTNWKMNLSQEAHYCHKKMYCARILTAWHISTWYYVLMRVILLSNSHHYKLEFPFCYILHRIEWYISLKQWLYPSGTHNDIQDVLLWHRTRRSRTVFLEASERSSMTLCQECCYNYTVLWETFHQDSMAS